MSPFQRRTTPICLLSLIVAVGACALPSTAQADDHHVIVSFKKGKAAKLRTMGLDPKRHARIKHELPGIDAVAMVVTGAELRTLRQNRDVEFVEEDVLRYPMSNVTASTGSPYLSGQKVPYGIRMVQADQLPDTNASNRMVCIIDTGYDRNHEDLPNGSSVTGEYDAGTGWWFTDEDFHGTHIAGTIAALNNAGTGVVGVAANNRLKLHIVKVFGINGWAYSSTLAAAAEKCAAAGANVISMSLGGGKSSRAERATFDALEARGILSISASGNSGNSTLSYPAAYNSVVMVGAVNEQMQHAGFSQYNSKVELAAPGVQIYSTVPMGFGSTASLTAAGGSYQAGTLAGSPGGAVTAALADFGAGQSVDASMAGKVCLIARGVIPFATKVLNCQASGGVAAIIYNNAGGAYSGTLGGTTTAIPSITVSSSDGARLQTRLGSSATVKVSAIQYAHQSGTSMAVPHVAAVAALVWSYFPACTGRQIRGALTASARDLSKVGRNVYFGYGLVQARAAHDRLAARGCAG